MRKKIVKVVIYFSLLSLYGCMPFSLSVPHDPPEQMNQPEEFKRLIGQSSESIVRMLGWPVEILTDGRMQYLMYMSYSEGTDISFLFGIPVYASTEAKSSQHCLRFTIDSKNIIQAYKIKSKGAGAEYIKGTYGCRLEFWSIKQEKNLRPAAELQKRLSKVRAQQQAEHDSKIKNLAEQGDASSQLSLYRLLVDKETGEALRWLCRSADQGNLEARRRLATLYSWKGSYTKEREILGQDNIQAYLWYSLAGDEPLFFAEQNEISEKELILAKSALAQWQPGQCERDLGLQEASQ